MADTTRYDQAARLVARLDPAGFLTWLLHASLITLRFSRWLGERTTPLPGEREQTADTFAELEQTPIPGPPWAFPLEFQTVPDPAMFGRLLVQMGQTWQDQVPDDLPGSRYQLAAGVVNLTGTRESMPASRQYFLPLPERLGCGLWVKERYLAEESAPQTLEAIVAKRAAECILALIPLMHGAGESGTIARWIEVMSQIQDDRRRSELAGLALVLVDLREWSPAWHKALEGWNVVESPTVARWMEQASLRTMRDWLKMLLEEKCGPLPPPLLEQLKTIDDPERLRKAALQSVHITRLDELKL
jgi:hypothetical protein